MSYATIASDEKVISKQQLSQRIVRRAISLQNEVRVFKTHPSTNTRAHLKAEANALAGSFSLAMELIGYRELPDTSWGHSIRNPREEVRLARDAVAELYTKKK